MQKNKKQTWTFLEESVPVLSVLFTVATSCKLWIIKFTHTEELFFTHSFKRKFKHEKCWSSRRKYKCYPEFLSELFDNKDNFLSEKKLVLYGDIN